VLLGDNGMPDRTRILFCTGVFFPHIGGPAKITQGLAERLTNRGYNCTVLTYGDARPPTGRGDNTIRPYSLVQISFSLPQPFRFIKILFKTYQLAQKNDVIYALDTYSNGLAAALISKLIHKPLILRFTGDSVWETAYNQGKTTDDITTFQNKKHVGLGFLLWRRNLILKTVNKIITDCEFLKKLLLTIGVNESKITVINNPVDTLPKVNFDREQYKKEHNLKNKVLMTMGRIVPWKGIKALIEIMPYILEKHSDTSLVIIGDGPELDNLKKLVSDSKLTDSVTFLGKITDTQEKSKLYDVTDVVVLNTFYEGMSNVLLEAMALKKPVVTTRVGGNPEFVNNDNGILVEYNNKEQITSAILKLLDNSDRAQSLGEHGYQTTQQYTWDSLVEKNINVIDKLLTQS
jgi:glycosyltransferase involved in cell wall biosynthesis